MATGKTHGRHVKIYIDATTATAPTVEMTCSVDNIGGVGLEYEDVDVTTLCNSVRQYLTGYADSQISLSGPFDNTATTGAHTILSAAAGDDTGKTITVQIGIRTAPTTGDPEWAGDYVCNSYMVDVAPEVRWTANFRPKPGASAPAWGTV